MGLAVTVQWLGRLGRHERLATLRGREPQRVSLRDLPFCKLVASGSASGAARG